MIRLTIGVLAGLSLASPAIAAPWVTDYQMGTFAASGGDETEGQLILECGDPDSGMFSIGELYMLFMPASGAGFNKKQPLTYLTFTVGSDTFEVPIELEPGSDTFAYVHEAEGAVLTQGLVAAMRGGDSVQVSLDGVELGDISLEGSDKALEAIDECIRFRS